MGDARRYASPLRAALAACALALAVLATFTARAEQILPRILSQTDAALYARIFAVQDAGDWATAERLMAEIEDPILMGHVLDQKLMHPTAYRSTFSDLAGYLTLYADHPEAGRVYRLALRRQPAGAAAPKGPVDYDFNGLNEGGEGLDKNGTGHAGTPAIVIPDLALSSDDKARRRQLEGEIKSRVRRGWPTGATEILTTAEFRALVSEARYDRLQATIAWSYFAYDKDDLAYAMASASAERSGALMPNAYWTAGLAAWRLGDIGTARRHFEALAIAEHAEGYLLAAGAYWAARANLITRQPEQVTHLLTLASAQTESFYGLIARRALGLAQAFAWSPPLDPPEIAALLGVPGAHRAAALVEAGQLLRAERELRELSRNAPAVVLHGLLAIAATLKVPSVEMALAGRLMKISGERHIDAFYPVPDWEPVTGYSIDPALLLALIRQESKFICQAKSRSGARGVMQLMPRTARSMARMIGMTDFERSELYDPAINIALGQAYIHHLLGQELIANNLFFMAAAYNSGPARLAKWKQKNRYFNDPLLFMESVPSPETRHFIETVLANYWIYQDRLGEPSPTLDAVAAGEWPIYIPNENTSEVAHAGN
jgi:soluble lytic murein transglycosylase